VGTKNNPGKFDCYAKAALDEPMFVLLGRDKFGASLVRLWAEARRADGEDPAKVEEAWTCSEAMLGYCIARKDVADVLDFIPFNTLARALRRRGAEVRRVPELPPSADLPIVVVYGARGCGKTRNKEDLRKALGCTHIVDDWDGRALGPGALALTNDENIKRVDGIQYLEYASAMTLVPAAPSP
jgi:hypothetical protein